MPKKAPAKKAAARKGTAETALDRFQAKMDKTYGSGKFRRVQPRKYDIISTGSITLDMALVVGGLVRGRTAEVWGPEGAGKTTLAILMCVQAQRAIPGKAVLWIDMEHRFDPKWGRDHGLDLERTVVVQTENAEEVADMVKDACREGIFSMIVLDSIGAMIPEKEKEKDAGDAVVGTTAKIITRMVKIAAVEADKTQTAVVWINQVRANIGYGCVHGDTVVPFVDGSSAKMRDVVQNKMSGDVWAWSDEEDRFVPRPIVDWHTNGSLESGCDWIHFTTDVIESRGGRHGFTLTPEHLVLTPQGWIRASDLSVGDRVASRYRSVVEGDVESFLWGTLVGDCHVTPKGQLIFQDSLDPGYLAWKIDKLSAAFGFTSTDTSRGVRWGSAWHHELRQVADEARGRNPMRLVRDHPSVLGLAVWYMDDGWIEYSGADPDVSPDQYRMAISAPRPGGAEAAACLASTWGLDASYVNGSVYFSRSASRMLAEMIAPFVPPCMERKLPRHLRGQYQDFTLQVRERQARSWATILSRQDGRPRDGRWPSDLVKYDISVEGARNYQVGGVSNGITVHNSDTTTGGGYALKHSTTMKLAVRRTSKGQLKIGSGDNEQQVGHRITVNVERNSVALAYRKAEFSLLYVPTEQYGAMGIDQADEAATVGLAMDLIELSGAWYTNRLTGERFQGRPALVKGLRNDPESVAQIRERAIEALSDQVVAPEDEKRELSFDDGPEEVGS